MGLKDAIRTSNDRPREPVEIPEWDLGDEQLFVCRCATRHLEALERLMDEIDGPDANQGEALAEFFSIVTCDEEGKQVFHWDVEEDREILLDRDPAVLARVLKPALKLNAGRVQEADANVEKSAPAPDSDSGSA